MTKAILLLALLSTSAFARPAQTPEEQAQECKDYGRCAAVEPVRPVLTPADEADLCKHYGDCGKPAERYLPDTQPNEERQENE